VNERGGRGAPPLQQAFDELRFGRERILNLRASLPTPQDACARAEAWLRERQVAKAGDVLIITGRGAGSHDGVSVVREAIYRLLCSLRRRGVVQEIQEHTAGSYVVELAPVRALREAPSRQRDARRQPAAALPVPRELEGLSEETRTLLARLAELTLADVGVRNPAPYLQQEMLAQLARLLPSAPGSEPERQLQRALLAAIDEHEGP
jgi:hypothetical protein